jgi:hypothetical protein
MVRTISCVCGRSFSSVEVAVHHVEEIHLPGELPSRQFHGWEYGEIDEVEEFIATKLGITVDEIYEEALMSAWEAVFRCDAFFPEVPDHQQCEAPAVTSLEIPGYGPRMFACRSHQLGLQLLLDHYYFENPPE